MFLESKYISFPFGVVLAAALTLSLPALSLAQASEPLFAVGVARVDITPDYPVRLGGFPARKGVSDGTAQRVWAKALAIGRDADRTIVIVTLDHGGIPGSVTDRVAARLKAKRGILRNNFVTCSSHSHSTPYCEKVRPLLFTPSITSEERQTLLRYETELTDHLEQVALAALERRRPGRLHWTQGIVEFARNSRFADGPTDSALPLLRVTDPGGSTRALFLSYACHANTYAGNKISGDWAGFAQEIIEEDHPGATCLVAIGCGGDQFPRGGTGLEGAREQGAQIAEEVDRLLRAPLRPLAGSPVGRLRWTIIPFDPPPSRDELARRASQGDSFGDYWKEELRKHDRGELRLPQALSFPVQSFTFGDDLAMVFLGGEAVVDYSLRLKKELDASRLWVLSYANEVRACIPSRRTLEEESDGEIHGIRHSGLPSAFAPEIESRIIDTVKELVPPGFRRTPPRSAQESLRLLHLSAGFEVELVAAEPLTRDPVAIAWGADGKLWVVEMADYPLGLDGRMEPGGRVRFLEDTTGDGRYDKSTLFLEELSLPNGILPWRDGVLITAAPEILFARDTDGDGRADVRRALYRGFVAGNPQMRVNGLRWGLDNWVYCANGSSGGLVESIKTGASVDLRRRDVRLRPDAGLIDPQSGVSQFGRNRDDWGNWFGSNNSFPLWHYVLADHYTRRNPHVAPPDSRRQLMLPANPVVFPAKPPEKRFRNVNHSGRFTSACSAMVYRDDLLFPRDQKQHAFICEPAHNLVRHETIVEDGVSFRGERLAEDQQEEFLASEDRWFRPVMVRTGPDGALWIVDMYRYAIEHPEFLSAEGRRELGPFYRSGEDRGRLYRVVPKGRRPRPVPRLDTLTVAGLVARLESPSGWERDTVQQMLFWRQDPLAVESLQKLVRTSPHPLTRLQALCTLDGLSALDVGLIETALGDACPGVRRHAVRLAETRASETPELVTKLLRRVGDGDRKVLLQLACTLGELRNPRAGPALGRLALAATEDVHFEAAILSSVTRGNVDGVLTGVLAAIEQGTATRAIRRLVEQLLGVAADVGRDDVAFRSLGRILKRTHGSPSAWEMEALAALLEALDRHGTTVAKLEAEWGKSGDEPLTRLTALVSQARVIAQDETAGERLRIAAIRLLAHHPREKERDLELLGRLLVPATPLAVQSAAVTRLGRQEAEGIAGILLRGWRSHSPAVRAQVLSVLLCRSAWLRALLDHVERGDVLPSDIDAGARQRFAAHPRLRRRVEKLLSPTAATDREAVIRDYQSAIRLPGDSDRGAVVFQDRCSPCHRLGRVGYEVGPNLLALTDNSPGALLTAILDPNRSVDPRFTDYVAVTTDGRIHTGLLASDAGNSITLLGQSGERWLVLRKDLVKLETAGKSMMPEGLEADLSLENIADVIAYVRSLAQDQPNGGN